MFTTRKVLALLRKANPGSVVTEDRVRHALRRGVLALPHQFAGRLAWTTAEVEALARGLGLNPPALCSAQLLSRTNCRGVTSSRQNRAIKSVATPEP